MAINMEYKILSNGVKIPAIGYGTWKNPDLAEAERCVIDAVANGYRLIDTAYSYGNEKAVGAAIKKCGIDRSELFVTTKHWVTFRGYENTLKEFDSQLKDLGLDYLDLYLIHWPCVKKLSEQWREVNLSTWRAFEKLYNDGYIRSIGVSNFEPKHLDALLDGCNIPPMVNQLEFHPGYTQLDTCRYSMDKGLIVEAWSPLGSGEVLNSPQLIDLAAKYNKSVAQICLRFATQTGIIPLPKSTKPERMKTNLDVFDFELSADDMKTLYNMPSLGFSGFFAEDAHGDELAAERAGLSFAEYTAKIKA